MTQEKQFYLCFARDHTEWLNFFCCCWWPRWHQTPIPLYCSVQKSSTLLLLRIIALTKTQHYNFHRQNHTIKYSIFSYPRAQTGIRSWRVHWCLGHQRGWVVGRRSGLKILYILATPHRCAIHICEPCEARSHVDDSSAPCKVGGHGQRT